MAYLFPWIALILGSLAAGIGLFVWACRSGQFSDQGRARYLPLREMDLATAHRGQILPAKTPYELVALLAGAIAVLLLTLVLVCLKGNGG